MIGERFSETIAGMDGHPRSANWAEREAAGRGGRRKRQEGAVDREQQSDHRAGRRPGEGRRGAVAECAGLCGDRGAGDACDRVHQVEHVGVLHDAQWLDMFVGEHGQLKTLCSVRDGDRDLSDQLVERASGSGAELAAVGCWGRGPLHAAGVVLSAERDRR